MDLISNVGCWIWITLSLQQVRRCRTSYKRAGISFLLYVHLQVELLSVGGRRWKRPGVGPRCLQVGQRLSTCFCTCLSAKVSTSSNSTRHLDTSLIDVDVQPTYARISVKGKVCLYFRFPWLLQWAASLAALSSTRCDLQDQTTRLK